MNTESDNLKSIAEEIVAGKSTDIAKPNYHLQVEAKRLEKAIIDNLNTIENFTQRVTFHFNTLSKLVNICDLLFYVTGAVNADAMVLIELLATVRQVIPNEIRPNLKLPKRLLKCKKTVLSAFGQITAT